MKQNDDKSPFKFEGQTSFYAGKVRDVYTINEDLLIMVASDRVSAFDFILPREIPHKGQILNQLAEKFLRDTTDIVSNWVIDLPDPNVTVGRKCVPFKIEMVIRGYLAGHAWREYKAGKRMICGVPMPDGMKENDKFPSPLITPATKADEGHDEDISREEIIAQGIVGSDDYIQLENYTRALFERGQKNAQNNGLILVDTKYEFGKIGEQIYLMDEIHTPDSSRYFYANSYLENQKNGTKQKQLSKEFVREWLMSKGFQGLEGQEMPEMSDEVVQRISNRYIELYEQLTGEEFIAATGDNREKEMFERTTILIDSIQHKRSESLKQN